MELDFSNYHFDVKAGVDSLSWQVWSEMTDEALFEAIGLKHHSKLVAFILECQTYPTPQSMLLALTLANNFNPKERSAWPSQSTLGELLGVSRDVVRAYTKDLESTGYWIIEKNPVTNFITYRLAHGTMMVLGQWLAQDQAGKREYGKGSPNIVSKRTKPVPGTKSSALLSRLPWRWKAVRTRCSQMQEHPPMRYWLYEPLWMNPHAGSRWTSMKNSR